LYVAINLFASAAQLESTCFAFSNISQATQYTQRDNTGSSLCILAVE
jgi:hypothetical protein